MQKTEKILLLISLGLLGIHLISGVRATHILFDVSLWVLAIFYSVKGYFLFKDTIKFKSLCIITGIVFGLVLFTLPSLIMIKRDIQYILPVFPIAGILLYYLVFSVLKKHYFKHLKGIILRSSVLLVIILFFAFPNPRHIVYQAVSYSLNRDLPSLKANINSFRYERLYKKADKNKQFDSAIQYAIKSKNEGLNWLGVDNITDDSKSDLWRIHGVFTNLYNAYTNKGSELYDTEKYREALQYYQLAEKELYYTDSIPKSYRDEAAYVLRNQAMAIKEFSPELADSLFYKAIVTYQELVGSQDIFLSDLLVDYAKYLKEQEYYDDSNVIYRVSKQLIEDNELLDFQDEIVSNNQNIVLNLSALDSLQEANKIINENYNLMSEDSDYYCINLFYDAFLKLEIYELDKAEKIVLKAKDCYETRELPISVSESLSLQASISLAKGSYKKAKEEIIQGTEIIVNQIGKNNVRYHNFKLKEASIELQLGNYSTAETIYIESLSYMESTFGKTHLNLIDPLLNLSEINLHLGRFNALKTYTKKTKYQIDETVDIYSIQSATTLNKIAYLYYAQDDVKTADSIYNHILLSNKEKTYLKADISVTLNGKGLVALYKENYKTSDSLFQKAIALSLEVYGKNHPNNAKIYYNIAELNLNKGNTFLAKKELKKSKEIALLKYPDSHDFFGDISFLYAQIARIDKEEEDSKAHAKKALSIYISKFGNEHYLSKRVRDFIDAHS